MIVSSVWTKRFFALFSKLTCCFRFCFRTGFLEIIADSIVFICFNYFYGGANYSYILGSGICFSSFFCYFSFFFFFSFYFPFSSLFTLPSYFFLFFSACFYYHFFVFSCSLAVVCFFFLKLGSFFSPSIMLN